MKKKKLDPQMLEGVSKIFKALCEPLRLRILQELQVSEKSISELCLLLGSPRAKLSKHLKHLIDANLLKQRQVGPSAYYSIANPMVLKLCETICNGIQKKLVPQL